MNKSSSAPISRRHILASALGVCTLAALPKQARANPSRESTRSMEFDLSSPEAYIQAVDESDIGWSRYTLGPNGECCLAGTYRTYELAEADCISLSKARVGATQIMTVAVKVGKNLIGYIKALVRKVGPYVRDWIIEEIINAGAHYLIQRAANNLLGKSYVSTYTFPCSVYPPHSGEYHRCMSA